MGRQVESNVNQGKDGANPETFNRRAVSATDCKAGDRGGEEDYN